MTEDDKNWLAADYVLGVMRGAEKAAFEAELKNDPELAKSVLEWQQRLSMVEPQVGRPHPGMSELEVDVLLNQVFDRVCNEIGTQLESQGQMPNPLKNLSAEQVASMRPMVSRLLASYLVLLERLKIQQARLAGSV